MEASTKALSRSELVEIFTRWDQEAVEGNRPTNPNPQAAADKFLELANAVKDQ